MRLEGDLFATWEAGDASDKIVRLPIIDDGIPEEDETLTLSLSAVSGGATLGVPPSAAVDARPHRNIICLPKSNSRAGGAAGSWFALERSILTWATSRSSV